MRLGWMALLVTLALPALHAQEGTLEGTMKFLQDTLNQQGQLKWVQTPKAAPANAVSVVDEVTDAVADPGSCTLAFKQDHRFPDYRVATTWKMPVREVAKVTVESLEDAADHARARAGQPAWDSSTTPRVFSLQFEAAPGKKFQSHRKSVNASQEVIERDQEQPLGSLYFRDEVTAQQFSKALMRARDLCAADR
jgi:hypothetical protein